LVRIVILEKVHAEYPPEEGRYLRGNDYSSVDFKGQLLYDQGAWHEPPLSGKIMWKVTQPWSEPQDDKERAAKQHALELIEKLKSQDQAGNLPEKRGGSVTEKY